MGRIVYDKLLAKMKEKGLTTYRIRQENIINEGTLQRIRDNKSITMDTLAVLCEVLDCQPADLIEYVKD